MKPELQVSPSQWGEYLQEKYPTADRICGVCGGCNVTYGMGTHLVPSRWTMKGILKEMPHGLIAIGILI